MIEINLLPDDMRKPEGTPPARLGAIIVSVIVASVILVLAGSYQWVHIPAVKNEIVAIKADIASLEIQKAEVEKVFAAIEKLKAKVTALDNLNSSRVRYARVLNQLCNAVNAVPEGGAWFRSFAVSPDNSGITGQGGKRYQIALTGYTSGTTQPEMYKRLTDLTNGLARELGVPDAKFVPPVGQEVPEDFGMSKFMKLRFDRPQILNAGVLKLPEPSAEDKKAIKGTTGIGLDFSLMLRFELPKPKQAGL